MKKNILFIVLVLLFHCEIKGKPLWTSIDSSNNEKCITITTLESNENAYKAKIEIHGYYDDLITIEGTTYHQLSFDKPATLSFIGEPALPIISRLIALPKGDNLEVKIKDEKWSRDFFVGQLMPKQRSVLETEKEPPFEKDATIYGREEYQTERFYIGELQRWRGINNRALNICPVRYMPREGKMSVLKEFVLDISFEGEVTGNLPKNDDNHMFLNQINGIERSMTVQMRDPAETYDYLIIAGDINGVLECQALADFQRWKAFKGFKTKVVSTNTIGKTSSQIKQYLLSEYSKGIRYVLFIGDCDKINPYYGLKDTEYILSDYWFGCIDDSLDVQADICIGRFSTNDLSELTNMVNKTISYEGNARSYGNEVLLVAHQSIVPTNFTECSNAIMTYNYYSEPVSFTKAYGASVVYGGNNATNLDVIREINEGKNIINYRGNGDCDRWNSWDSQGDSFKNSHIIALDNTTNDIYFCITSENGNILSYIGDSCLMETFMSSNHGAAGMIAATEPVYNIVNNSFDQYLFIKLFNEHIYNIGDLNVAAHITNIATTAATDSIEHKKAIFNAFCYLCGCDPSLEIITDNTNNFDDYTLSLYGQDLIVDCKNISGYKVCIVNENDSLLSVVNTTNAACSLPLPTDNFYLVLNKHNYVPRIIYVNVTDSNIQNKVFNNTDMDYYYIKDATISVGYNVTTSIPYGNVTIESGSKLSINKKNGVYIKNGFKCKTGGELLIK